MRYYAGAEQEYDKDDFPDVEAFVKSGPLRSPRNAWEMKQVERKRGAIRPETPAVAQRPESCLPGDSNSPSSVGPRPALLFTSPSDEENPMTT